jgi:hypothetical protein
MECPLVDFKKEKFRTDRAIRFKYSLFSQFRFPPMVTLEQYGLSIVGSLGKTVYN